MKKSYTHISYMPMHEVLIRIQMHINQIIFAVVAFSLLSSDCILGVLRFFFLHQKRSPCTQWLLFVHIHTHTYIYIYSWNYDLKHWHNGSADRHNQNGPSNDYYTIICKKLRNVVKQQEQSTNEKHTRSMEAIETQKVGTSAIHWCWMTRTSAMSTKERERKRE